MAIVLRAPAAALDRNMPMQFDPAKDLVNQTKHGLSLADFDGFDAEPIVAIDDRLVYGEIRYRAWGWIAGRGYCLVYTVVDANIRAISFRRAHDKEMQRYGQADRIR